MKAIPILVLITMLFYVSSCTTGNASDDVSKMPDAETEIVSNATIVKNRFPPPKGFERKSVPSTSFASFLRNLPLKRKGASVLYYNGAEKQKHYVYEAVVDLPIGNRDLHQCADAVMRLYAEYLYNQKEYSKICFNFLSDGKPRCYLDYVKGDYSYKSFWKYMEYVFAYANTASLFDQMKPVKDINDIKIGDAFIEKKRPYGHAVIVADMAVNSKGEKVFLLMQSYMPAQELQVLKNPKDSEISPWFRVPTTTLKTPEWSFKPEHLRRF